MARRVLGAVLLATVGLVALLALEAVLARRGAGEPFTNPSPEPRDFGSTGPRLTYVVLGDSTGAGQGASYDDGIAVATARHLARRRRVTLVNRARSGARMADVVREQLPAAVALRPGAVLLAAGANDVTGLTSARSVRRSLERIVRDLRAASPGVALVVTGAPDMGTPPRLAQPLRRVAGLRARRLNETFRAVAAARALTFAPIADETGPAFAADPGLFAADEFHPDARGYATWAPVLHAALDRALGVR